MLARPDPRTSASPSVRARPSPDSVRRDDAKRTERPLLTAQRPGQAPALLFLRPVPIVRAGEIGAHPMRESVYVKQPRLHALARAGQRASYKKQKRGCEMDGRLRPAARDMVAEGSLPENPSSATYGGPSSGTTCRLCGEPIRTGAPEIELVFGIRERNRGSALLHPNCYAIWLAEARSNHASA